MHTILPLTVSNIFMTFAWYGHLKYKDSPWDCDFGELGNRFRRALLSSAGESDWAR